MKRPLGITILSIISILGGIYTILLGGFGSILGLNHILETAGAPAGSSGTLGIFSTLLLITGILFIIYGLGLWHMKKWAWSLALFSQVINIISAAYHLANHTGNSSATFIYSIIFSVLILLYLLKIKKQFHN